MSSEETQDRNETLVERFDFVETDRVSMSGVAEIEVSLATEELPEEIVSDTRSWVKHAVETHLAEQLSKEGSQKTCEAHVAETDEDDWILSEEEDSTETTYSVWVKFR